MPIEFGPLTFGFGTSQEAAGQAMRQGFTQAEEAKKRRERQAQVKKVLDAFAKITGATTEAELGQSLATVSGEDLDPFTLATLLPSYRQKQADLRQLETERGLEPIRQEARKLQEETVPGLREFAQLPFATPSLLFPIGEAGGLREPPTPEEFRGTLERQVIPGRRAEILAKAGQVPRVTTTKRRELELESAIPTSPFVKSEEALRQKVAETQVTAGVARGERERLATETTMLRTLVGQAVSQGLANPRQAVEDYIVKHNINLSGEASTKLDDFIDQAQTRLERRGAAARAVETQELSNWRNYHNQLTQSLLLTSQRVTGGGPLQAIAAINPEVSGVLGFAQAGRLALDLPPELGKLLIGDWFESYMRGVQINRKQSGQGTDLSKDPFTQETLLSLESSVIMGSKTARLFADRLLGMGIKPTPEIAQYLKELKAARFDQLPGLDAGDVAILRKHYEEGIVRPDAKMAVLEAKLRDPNAPPEVKEAYRRLIKAVRAYVAADATLGESSATLGTIQPPPPPGTLVEPTGAVQPGLWESIKAIGTIPERLKKMLPSETPPVPTPAPLQELGTGIQRLFDPKELQRMTPPGGPPILPQELMPPVPRTQAPPTGEEPPRLGRGRPDLASSLQDPMALSMVINRVTRDIPAGHPGRNLIEAVWNRQLDPRSATLKLQQLSESETDPRLKAGYDRIFMILSEVPSLLPR